MVKSQGHWERKSKNVFHAYLRQKWIDLCRTKTKMISSPFYKYGQIHICRMYKCKGVHWWWRSRKESCI